MSRGDGLSRADIDVGLFYDPKFRRLAKVLPDERDFAAAFVVWLAPLLASWRDANRLTAEEGECAWVEATPERIAALKASGLLDDEGRVPAKPFASWFGSAVDRVEDKRFEGAVNGLVSHGWTREAAFEEANRRRVARGLPEVTSGRPRGPVDPSQGPPDPTGTTGTTRRAGAGRGSGGTSKPKTNGHDEAHERRRAAAVASVASGEVDGAAAADLMTSYGFTFDDVAAYATRPLIEVPKETTP